MGRAQSAFVPEQSPCHWVKREYSLGTAWRLTVEPISKYWITPVLVEKAAGAPLSSPLPLTVPLPLPGKARVRECTVHAGVTLFDGTDA
jgi:hypothetical protein